MSTCVSSCQNLGHMKIANCQCYSVGNSFFFFFKFPLKKIWNNLVCDSKFKWFQDKKNTWFLNINVFYFIYFIIIIIIFLFVVNSVIHWNEKALGSHVFPIPIPPPTSLPTRSLQVLPEHQVRELVSCIQPGPVICFTLDSIHVSMLFSWNIPPSPSPTESKRLFYKSVSLFLFCV